MKSRDVRNLKAVKKKMKEWSRWKFPKAKKKRKKGYSIAPRNKLIQMLTKFSILNFDQLDKLIAYGNANMVRRHMTLLKHATFVNRNNLGNQVWWYATNSGMEYAGAPYLAPVVGSRIIEKVVKFTNAVFEFIGDNETEGLVNAQADHDSSGMRYVLSYSTGGNFNTVVVCGDVGLVEQDKSSLVIVEGGLEECQDAIAKSGAVLAASYSDIMEKGPYKPIWFNGTEYVGLEVLGFQGKYTGPLMGSTEWLVNLKRLDGEEENIGDTGRKK